MFRIPKLVSSSSVIFQHIEPEITHFGSKKVRLGEKQGLVNNVFDNVASKYDMMNDVMSFGIHRLWKDYFIHSVLSPSPEHKILDMAGGTGDIALRILDQMRNPREGPSIPGISCLMDNLVPQSPNEHYSDSNIISGHVTVSDLNPNMLQEGLSRFLRGEKIQPLDDSLGDNIADLVNQVHPNGENTTGPLSWMVANAEDLPYSDQIFDAYTIAFGIRNVPQIEIALKEAYRVLKPGGRFLCLEFSHVSNPALAYIYDVFSYGFIPAAGQIIANDSASYSYLVESIREFPKQDDFQSMIESAGFKFCSYQNLTDGVVAIHSGIKIE